MPSKTSHFLRGCEVVWFDLELIATGAVYNQEQSGAEICHLKKIAIAFILDRAMPTLAWSSFLKPNVAINLHLHKI